MTDELLVTCAFCLGALVQTVAGFGSALVAMPVLTFVVSVRVAAPVQALIGAIVTITVLHQNWHALRWREAVPLIMGAAVGIPFGAWMLKSLPSEPITACLGLVLLSYGAFALRSWRRSQSSESPPGTAFSPVACLVGLAAGILGGAYATDGPPLIVYGAIKKWPKEVFKSILQSCFLVNTVFIVSSHIAAGLLTRDVLHYALFGLPGLLAGMALGLYLDRRVNHERFRALLIALILILGATLLGQALYGFFKP